MSKPIIGITVDCKHDETNARTHGKLELNWNYAEAVAAAGGVPVLIPPTADMVEVARIIDGWLIPGGLDIDASRFGQTNHPEVNLQDPERYEGEAALMGAVPDDLPILGICYGCQFINVVRGGSLHQHLPDVVGHTTHTGGTLQSYRLEAWSKLARFSQVREMEGKSYHHQAIDRLGEGLLTVATADDGTVEAIEADGHPYLIGVQWHPERTPDDDATQRLFQSLVRAAAAYKEKRCADSSTATTLNSTPL